MCERMLVAAVVIAAGGVCSVASAGNDNLRVGDVLRFADGPGFLGGGEFEATRVNARPGPVTAAFRTFCIQIDETLDFSPLGFRVIGISRAALADGRPLATETAFLYDQFRRGTLTGYLGNNQSANALQAALWLFQGQSGWATQTSSGWVALNPATRTQAAGYVAAAQAAVAGGWTNTHVRVLNLAWTTRRAGFAAGDHAQDVLALIPLPGAAAMALAGLGLLAVRRRRA